MRAAGGDARGGPTLPLGHAQSTTHCAPLTWCPYATYYASMPCEEAHDAIAHDSARPCTPATRVTPRTAHITLVEDSMPPISLTGLHRLSPCCRSAVYHDHPATSRSLDAILHLRCGNCGRAVTRFLVENADGVQIWPLPTDFQPKRVRIHFSAESRFICHQK